MIAKRKTILDIFSENFYKTENSIYYISSNKLYYFSGREYVDSVLKSQYYYRIYNKKDYYDWHVDFSLSKMNLFSYVLYLNDDFDGGELKFKNSDIFLKPKKGMLAVFDGGFGNEHMVTTVKTGERYTIGSFWDRADCVYTDEQRKAWDDELKHSQKFQNRCPIRKYYEEEEIMNYIYE